MTWPIVALRVAAVQATTKAASLGVRSCHVLVNSPLGRYIDNMKRERKAAGANQRSGVIVPRSRAYWQDVAV